MEIDTSEDNKMSSFSKFSEMSLLDVVFPDSDTVFA